jgi:hypothetical protein
MSPYGLDGQMLKMSGRPIVPLHTWSDARPRAAVAMMTA